jgi:hypothetical protein
MTRVKVPTAHSSCNQPLKKTPDSNFESGVLYSSEENRKLIF